MYKNFALLCFLTCWCPTIQENRFGTHEDLMEYDRLQDERSNYLQIKQREKRSTNAEKEAESDEAEALVEDNRDKRASSSYFTPEYCKKLGYCGLMASLSSVCLIKCNFDIWPLFKPFLDLIGEVPKFLCQSVNTIYSSLPLQSRSMSMKTPDLKAYLRRLNVNPNDEADFAKTSANALAMTIIKRVKSTSLDYLKPLIKNLEIRDTGNTLPEKSGRFFGSLINPVIGQFLNQICDKTNLENEALMLVSAMKTSKKNLDLLIPGYFVLNKAPKLAATSEIRSFLNAWNMPLTMFTGVKCAMAQFATEKFKPKCDFKYKLINTGRKFPLNNGPDSVCGAIPTFAPILAYSSSKNSNKQKQGVLGGRAALDDETETEETTVNPCTDANKDELEECMTESVIDDYSEDLKGRNEENEADNEEIASDEVNY